ncbi:Acetylxylan esterase precursor [Symmachiella macrocystis]|uniref:Acetylxylan esterase n=1 Tax=Symmachiella macrocystis TaxID=2527985 RepID=A0A5C6BD45_9PLAN|nr:alpha/beta hydrolase [Symmachiella macrocystis]TWU09206.1 Acetylxylan esterase precursor [Symmachiella macrocystis]
MSSTTWLTRCSLFAASLVIFSHSVTAAEPTPELLWPDGAPGAVGDEPLDKPTITIFPAPADIANGAAVVVCPGGGYGGLAAGYEGDDVARWLNTLGVTGVVLRYRLGPRYHHPAPLQDAQRAIRTVRARAKSLGVDPERIGILGFSAGGHLTSTAATHFDNGEGKSADPIQRESSRPDFAILCYPVISMTDAAMTHTGSRRNLLGDKPSAELMESVSSEKQVTEKTPPCFLWHTTGDKGVPSENSIAFYLACKEKGVPVELHIFEKGRHGLGLGKPDESVSAWPPLCTTWMKDRGLLNKK